MRRSTVLNGPRRTTDTLGMSALLRLACFPGFTFCGFAFGLFLRAIHALGQFLAAGFTIPLFIGLRRDVALDQQLGELAPLRLALEWHPCSSPTGRPVTGSFRRRAYRAC